MYQIIAEKAKLLSDEPILLWLFVSIAVLLLLTFIRKTIWKRRHQRYVEFMDGRIRQGRDELSLIKVEIEKTQKASEKRLSKLSRSIEEEGKKLTDLMKITVQRETEAIAAQEKLDGITKRVALQQTRFNKRRGLFESALQAMAAYAAGEPGSDKLLQSTLDATLSEYDAITPADIKALTIKDLRAQFREKRKEIQELCQLYQDKYTTKTNTTIYRLLVLALEEGVQNIYHSLSFGKLETAINAFRVLTTKCFEIAIDGNQTIISTLSRFIGQIEVLYIQAITIEYEYYVKRERAKEEQRAIREQMRQEAEERKALEQQRRQVENEERKYHNEIERIQDQVKQTADEETILMLKRRIAEVEALLSQVEEKKEEIITLQNGKAGTVYIISNLGAFGDHMFKIGMTRRLEPMDRVRELGDASVPFPFDVHSLVFSEDAVSLEYQLHKELAKQRVNKVNMRKEFFDVTIDELEALVNKLDPSAPFERTMLAEQYHQSLSIDLPPEESAADMEADDGIDYEPDENLEEVG